MTKFPVRDKVHTPEAPCRAPGWHQGEFRVQVIFLTEETSGPLGPAPTERIIHRKLRSSPRPVPPTCHTPCRGRWWWGLSRRWWCYERASSSPSSTRSGHCQASASQRGQRPELWSPGWCHRGCGRGRSVPVGS